MPDSNIKALENNEYITAIEKIETIAKVLQQTLYEDSDLFDLKDSKNLCSVLLRETSYFKSRIIYSHNNSPEKIIL